MKYKLVLFMVFVSLNSFSQEIAVVKYRGGGDWYANPTSLPNLIRFCNANIQTNLRSKPAIVEPSSPDLFNYPYLHITGHGNVVFNAEEEIQLRDYLKSGGFLHIDDNYGMNDYIRKTLQKLFPLNELVEIPTNHPIFQKPFPFPKGLPKIHEHDNKRPQAFGIFIKNRLAVLYTYECDLGDGWENAEVNNDPLELRQQALKMGANIIYYIFNN